MIYWSTLAAWQYDLSSIFNDHHLPNLSLDADVISEGSIFPKSLKEVRNPRAAGDDEQHL